LGYHVRYWQNKVWLKMKLNNFALYAWGVLVYNIFVILWGAFVRATGSGAGCGNHWPACNGQIIPLTNHAATLIEFTHRLTSGLSLLLIVVLLIWAFRSYGSGHPVRLGASLSMFFIIVEALIGAGLVLFELVAYDTSVSRAVVIALHLMNTFILLGVLALTAWWASGGQAVRLRGQGWLGWALWAGFAGLLLLGASGAVTALGDTLFPATSLAEGLQQKFSPTAHFLIRLRLYHPLIAIALGIYTISAAGIFNLFRATPVSRKLARFFMICYLAQLAAGAANVVLLAPIWMQLFHLLLSDLLLIVWVLFMAAAFGERESQQESRLKAPLPSGQEISLSN
jgi:heme A synthase